jgi:hypothetical protein
MPQSEFGNFPPQPVQELNVLRPEPWRVRSEIEKQLFLVLMIENFQRELRPR